MAEWSKAPDSSSGLRKEAWVQIPLLTFLKQFAYCNVLAIHTWRRYSVRHCPNH
uniref:Uncharacterized protein n=1 Tax=Nelumbo nucifera TaxID=4432 RepID=A0A822Y7G1_NELNU|nr:TPA_asm: hypothetical protein HUJ06_028423 [Nelumbo nucifera]